MTEQRPTSRDFAQANPPAQTTPSLPWGGPTADPAIPDAAKKILGAAGVDLNGVKYLNDEEPVKRGSATFAVSKYQLASGGDLRLALPTDPTSKEISVSFPGKDGKNIRVDVYNFNGHDNLRTTLHTPGRRLADDTLGSVNTNLTNAKHILSDPATPGPVGGPRMVTPAADTHALHMGILKAVSPQIAARVEKDLAPTVQTQVPKL
jgi:hypothetical protein